MSNFLPNGAVLPSGLLSSESQSMMDGFKKTYQNSSLRVGIVIQTYTYDNPKNVTKIAPEYDVLVLEQNEDKGATVITYKNCLAASSLGSIADYFEMTLRKLKNQKDSNRTPSLEGQDGNIVLLLCLDSMSDKGIIIGSLGHPDRKTTLTDEGPRLEGEFNGVNVKVEKDGSTTLTFKGATNNDGTPADSSQGNTVATIEKDGSFQLSHKTITQRLDKNGKATLTANDNISNVTKKDFDVNADNDVNLTATNNMSLAAAKFIASISGSASLSCNDLTVSANAGINFRGSSADFSADGIVNMSATQVNINGQVNLGAAGGQPILLLSTMFLGVGNLGAPVVSYAVSGFSGSVFSV